MKKSLRNSLIVLVFTCFALMVNAQTLVNKAWQDTTGHPNLTLSLLVGVKDDAGNLLVGGNTYEADSEYVLITKYNTGGTTLWQQKTSAGGGKRGFVTHMTTLHSNVYSCGASWDSVNNKAKWNTVKINSNTGAALWSKTYSGAYVGYDVPASIVTDSLGYIYVAGTEQTDTNDYEVTVIKYDTGGTVVWTAHYDSVGLYDGAVALAISYATGNVIMTGYSGSAFNTWDFLTIGFDMATGAKSGVTRASNGSGAFVSHPASLAIGEHNSIYVVGAAAGTTTGNVDVKIIKYDSLFNQVWVKTWGLPDSLDDEPAYMVINRDLSRVMITGYTTHANGEIDQLTMAYDKNGNLLWGKTATSGTGPVYAAKGNSIVTDDSSNVYTTGQVYNGSNYDMLTSAYDKNGSPLWQKNYDGGGSSDDIGLNVSLDSSNNVYVSGTNVNGTTKYITVKYTQFKKVDSLVYDSLSNPAYIAHEMIIKFNPTEVNTAIVNNKDWQYGKLSDVIPDSVRALMAAKAGVDQKILDGAVVVKIFMRMTTADSISISRLGDTIKMPTFWSVFKLELPDTLVLSNTIDSFRTLSRYIIYADTNHISHLTSLPDDTYIGDGFEAGLLATTAYPDANINMDPAWDIETGKDYVKVGVYDAIIDWTNEDFGDGTFAGSKIVGGWDFSNNTSASTATNPKISHGTACAGIIGALRNNNKGVAGIAGGDVNAGNTGCQLFTIGIEDQKTENNTTTTEFITDDKEADAIVEGSAYNPGTGYGYGFNITSNSYGGSSSSSTIADAIEMCFKNQCLFVASRGNSDGYGGSTSAIYPACYNNTWLMSVGASGTDGVYKDENNGDNWWSSYYGANMDLIAPGTTEIVTAPENPNYPFADLPCINNINNDSYHCFNGTSAAAPHVAGVAALMMSRHNVNQGYANNLAPDDVKFLIDQYATDISGTGNLAGVNYPVGYDDHNGWGRLNAGAVMAAINAPHYSVFHSGTPLSSIPSTISTNTALDLIQNTNTLAAGLYVGDLYKVTQTYSNNFSSTTQILHYWPRISSTTGTTASSPADGLPGGTYDFTVSGNTASVTANTYAWHVTGTYPPGPYSQALDVWIPDAPANLKTAYSLHLYDPDATGIISTTSFVNGKIYPNPAQDILYISVVLAQPSNITIQLSDLTGRVLEVKKLSGNNHYLSAFNTGNLAAGLYLCNIQTSTGQQQVKKFVKE